LPTLCSPKNKTFGDWGRQFPSGNNLQGMVDSYSLVIFFFSSSLEALVFVFVSFFVIWFWSYGLSPLFFELRLVIMDISEKFGKKGQITREGGDGD
jgi:hypothetical protein